MDAFFCFATRTKDAATSVADVAVSMTQKRHVTMCNAANNVDMPPAPQPMPNTAQVDCFVLLMDLVVIT